KRVVTVMAPYRPHPVTEGALVSRIGMALEEPPHTNAGAPLQAWEFCSVRVGITDEAQNHAIASAMIRVRDEGLDVFWSAAPNPIDGTPLGGDNPPDCRCAAANAALSPPPPRHDAESTGGAPTPVAAPRAAGCLRRQQVREVPHQPRSATPAPRPPPSRTA